MILRKKSVQAELEQTHPRLGTIYSLCSVLAVAKCAKSWNFLKTGFYEGINLTLHRYPGSMLNCRHCYQGSTLHCSGHGGTLTVASSFGSSS